jgi:dimethylaniline monooxygenase (N-oxide forming)
MVVIISIVLICAKDTSFSCLQSIFHPNILKVNFVPYMNELGEMISAKPNLWSIFKEDPKLAYQVFFGTTVPTQYRLQGPNTWKDARKHIMSFQEQYLCPLSTRKCAPSAESNSHGVLIFIFVIVFVVIAIMLKG